MIILWGLPGSGKSTLANMIHESARSIRAWNNLKDSRDVWISSDNTRKELFSEPKYTPGESERVHNVMLERARESLVGGVNVIVDATLLRREHRQKFANLARELDVEPLEVFVTMKDEEVLLKRLTDRENKIKGSYDLSDAGVAVYQRMKEGLDLSGERDHLAPGMLRVYMDDFEEILSDIATLLAEYLIVAIPNTTGYVASYARTIPGNTVRVAITRRIDRYRAELQKRMYQTPLRSDGTVDIKLTPFGRALLGSDS